MKKIFIERMNTVRICSLILFSCLFISCAAAFDPNAFGNASGDAILMVELQKLLKTDITIEDSPIVFASILLTDPDGGTQYAEWTNGMSLEYTFHSSLSGVHDLVVKQVDTKGTTNSDTATIDMQPGFNYYVYISLGGNVIITVSNGVTPQPENTASSLWLAEVLDRFHTKLSIYEDASSAANHFNFRGFMGNVGALMQEDVSNNAHSGLTCIQATVFPADVGWAGCYFQNGVLSGNDRTPQANWGTEKNAGMDLRGATTLTFWARGETGTEQVEFYAFGIGRSTNSGAATKPYPDSNRKISTGVITLGTQWQEYHLDVSQADLSYVIGGFGWSAVSRTDGVVFYLDDISYNKSDLGSPRFPLSYRTINSTNDFDLIVRNASYVYDASLMLMAFLSCGENARARLIADALVYAQDHDRYYTDGRLRNAYQAGDLMLPAGWNPNGKSNTVRMSGFWDSFHQNWYEDEYSISSSTGNIAWAMLALLAYYDICGGPQYLESVKRMGSWVVNNMMDQRGAGGFMAGVRGWEPCQTNITYKSTEHNFDLYVAFKRLYRITQDQRWEDYAVQASNFVMSMWHSQSTISKFFFTGTLDDGVTIFLGAIPTDCQSWTLLAFRDLPTNYWEGLTFNEDVNRIPGTWGFDFSSDKDGIWYEGTGQMALAYVLTGQESKYDLTLAEIQKMRAPSGAIYAADKEYITTGFANMDGSPWYYFHREHVGATAWEYFADKRINPFWLGTPYGVLP